MSKAVSLMTSSMAVTQKRTTPYKGNRSFAAPWDYLSNSLDTSSSSLRISRCSGAYLPALAALHAILGLGALTGMDVVIVVIGIPVSESFFALIGKDYG